MTDFMCDAVVESNERIGRNLEDVVARLRMDHSRSSSSCNNNNGENGKGGTTWRMLRSRARQFSCRDGLTAAVCVRGLTGAERDTLF